MIQPSIFAPSRIQGTKIASGRATWVYDDEKGGYYNFVDEDAFSWKLNPVQLQQLGIDEQDLLDCVLQAEKQLGSPQEFRPRLGLLPSVGYSNIGATYISRGNPNIMCVFTPTSMDFATTSPTAFDNAPIDAYFEWYYSPSSVTDKTATLDDFIKKYDELLGKAMTRDPSWENSPTFAVPTYEEACVFSDGYMSEEVRERFLQNVWDYHKATMRNRKEQLKENIVECWTRLNRVRKSTAIYE
jgi:hypothetical protein